MRTVLAMLAVGCSAPVASTAPAVVPAPVAPVSQAAPPPAPSPPARAGLRYPRAAAGNVVDTLHGVTVADPYRWLEDMGSPETRQWVSAENALTDAYLAELPGREVLHRRIAELVSYEAFRTPSRRGGRYFWSHSDGKRSQPVVYTAAALDAAPGVLLDPNTISTDGSLALAGLSISSRGERVAYGLSIGGGDWQKWRVRDIATLRDLPDELAHIKYYRPEFTRDGTGVYYSRFPAPPPGKELVETDHDCKVYFHRIGTGAAQDTVVYERPDHPTWQFDLDVTRDGRYLVITTGDGQVGDRGVELISYLDLSRKTKPVALIDTYDAEYRFLGNEGTAFYFVTTLGAPNKRIIAIDINHPARDRWQQVVAEGGNAIQSASLVGHQLIVTTLQDVAAGGIL